MMMSQGPFVFSLDTLAYQQLRRATDWRHAQNPRVGAPTCTPRCAHVSGFKAPIDATAWLVKRVEHNLGDNGFVTRLECETAATAVPPVSTETDGGGDAGD